jgi:hypothetical protein
MAGDVEIRPLAADDMLESIYEKVLAPIFTSDELEPLENLRGYLKDSPPAAFGLYAIDPDGGPIGCCIYYPYGDPEADPNWRTLLLGYMAVVRGARSGGVGGRLFHDSKERWFGADQYDLVLAELDDPRVYPVANGIDPEKRITFYSRVGDELVCAPYFAPRLKSEGERVFDMLLTVLGGSDRARHTSSKTVSGDCIATFLTEYFTAEDEFTSQEGGPSDLDARDLAWLVDAYADKELRVIPVAEYRSWEPPSPPSRSSR